ncbi:uncharacterized protein [Rutidosis leptorrhynchoides]|uniref:uncharacterized protein n=1 Tax=Rutidosis leptorrhynchoides TaxID=125765 RepID=UPI003A9A4C4D
MSWVKWDYVINSFGVGGINIGSLRSKNLALLGKWWWKFKTETDAFLVKIIRSIHGVNGGLVLGNESSHSSTQGVWHNTIITGENKLCVLFPRLFRLEQSSNVTVKERMSEDGAVWQWRRTPTGRAAGDLVELNNLLSSFRFDRSLKDSWKWSMSSDGMFKVKILASVIDQHILPSSSSQHSTLRNNLVPKKVEIFVWRVLLRRLPVRTELDKRGIDLHSVLCPACDDVDLLFGGVFEVVVAGCSFLPAGVSETTVKSAPRDAQATKAETLPAKTKGPTSHPRISETTVKLALRDAQARQSTKIMVEDISYPQL